MTNVYVICPDHGSPSGGVMKLYELVDILNLYGIQSFVLHQTDGFRVTWFKNSTPIKYFHSVKIKVDDILIFPELYAANIPSLCPGVRKIVYNQNFFNTPIPFNDLNAAREVYFHPDIIQVLVVSEYDLQGINLIFPGIKLSIIHSSVNKELFHYSPTKTKTIAVMPRKLWNDFAYLQGILALNNELNGYSFKIINDMALDTVAEALKGSSIFLSFSYKESFGLPPAEAMACGCIVIGYHGQGGKEFFNERLTYPIEQSDLIGYAKCITSVIKEFDNNPDKMKRMGKDASDFILKKYSVAQQQDSISKLITHF